MKVIITSLILAVSPVVYAQDPPQMRITVEPGVVLPGVATQIVSGGSSGGNLIAGSPYSAEVITETTQTLSDGSHVAHKSSSIVYRDSNGRERRESPPMVTINDPIAGVHYILDANAHTARIMRMPVRVSKSAASRIEGGITVTGGLITPPSVRPSIVSPPTGTNLPVPKVEQLGTMNIEGVMAEGTRTTTIIPAGQIGNDRDLQIVSERWYSPDLKEWVLTKNSDPRTGETVRRFTGINRSEPLRSLFEIPADYTVSDAPGLIRAPNGTVQLP